MESFWRDLKYGVRTLTRSPGFTLIAIITLALGIGANTAIFSVVNAVVLAPLPYHQPNQLVIVWLKNPAGRFISPSYPDVQDWQRDTHSFDGIGAFTFTSYNLTSPGTPDHVNSWLVSSGFFKNMGVDFILGRDFSPEEDRRGGAQVALINERLWKERFGGSKAVLGKTVALNGADYTIVGVLPSGISLGGSDIDVYMPINQGDPLAVNDRRTHAFVAIGRLKPGATVNLADADVVAVQKNIDDLYPKAEHGLGAGIVPLKEALLGDVSGTLLMLLGSVGLVLLIACANVASLFMARAASREREFAIRTALGAKRARIVWQMITESVLLSLAGGGLSLALAKWGVRPVLAAVPGDFPRAVNVGLNPTVLLFTFSISIAMGMIFGFIPALKTWNANQQSALKAGGRGSTAVHHRTQSTLVIVQTALTLVLLVGAGLLLRTIRHLSQVNPGFETQQLVTFKVGLASDSMKTPENTRTAYQQLLQRIRGIAGVQSADLTTLVPLSGEDNEVPIWIGQQEQGSVAEAPRALSFSVGPDYFHAMEIPLLRGRSFTLADTLHSEQVIMIDNNLADAYFPGKDPIGQTITFARVGAFRVIGVVGHVKHWGLGNTNKHNQNQAYTSFYQIPDEWLPVLQPDTTVLVRTQLSAANLVPAVRAAVFGSGSQQPIYDVQTMQQRVSASMATQSFPMMLLGLFAVLALLLASVGTYGLLANFVQRRTQEIGVRMALGAQPRDVFRMMIRQGLRLTFTGVAIGVAGAFILTRVLSSFSQLLYGVGMNDPLTLSAAALLLIATAVPACYVPARRAAMVAPTEALRQE